MNRTFLVDLGERVGATAAEAGLSAIVVELSGIPAWWAAPLTMALAAAKGWLAKYVGDTGSAALLRRAKRQLPEAR